MNIADKTILDIDNPNEKLGQDKYILLSRLINAIYRVCVIIAVIFTLIYQSI